MWDEEIPWSPEEQDAYRRGGSSKPRKRLWKGPSAEELWRLYGRDNATLVACSDCARPCDKREAELFHLGRCWNCWKEHAYPGWQRNAIESLTGKKEDATPKSPLKKLGG